MLRELEPTFEQVVLEDAYGRILARTNLETRQKELMAVSALTAGRLPRQLESHIRGALAVGASPAEVAAAVDVAAEVSSSEMIAGARALVDRVVASAHE